ncbi:hypothetical protein [Pseudomonas sp. XK-1]|jgi:hypothetical protein|uniref:hypothetical protein n=1 Tax=Pseudomonas sp. XK-1 TaxID=3136019 RepID=UPI002D6FA54E|nr:hypothetical protein [Pseudomonas sp.]
MVIHYRVAGHLACGHHGSNLSSTSELAQVKCRSCRGTEVFKENRKTARNAARRATRKAKVAHASNDWRASWQQRLTDLPGRQRLPRGFGGQPFV